MATVVVVVEAVEAVVVLLLEVLLVVEVKHGRWFGVLALPTERP